MLSPESYQPVGITLHRGCTPVKAKDLGPESGSDQSLVPGHRVKGKHPPQEIPLHRSFRKGQESVSHAVFHGDIRAARVPERKSAPDLRRSGSSASRPCRQHRLVNTTLDFKPAGRYSPRSSAAGGRQETWGSDPLNSDDVRTPPLEPPCWRSTRLRPDRPEESWRRLRATGRDTSVFHLERDGMTVKSTPDHEIR